MDVTLPNGVVVKGIPDGTSKADFVAKARANGMDIPDSWMQPAKPVSMDTVYAPGTPERAEQDSRQKAARPKENEGSLADKFIGASEADARMAAGALGAVVQAPLSIFGNRGKGTSSDIEKGKYTPNYADKLNDFIDKAIGKIPLNEQGKRYIDKVGDVASDLKLEGIAPEVSPAVRSASEIKPGILSKSASEILPRMSPKKPALSGVGAAKTPEEILREQRASDLPVPIQLTKGQKSRSHEQQKFERETAKMPEGEPLRERYADQNEKVLQNFDAFIDKTDSKESSLRSVGGAVDKALKDKMQKVKEKINLAYADARSSGDMNEKVNSSALLQYLEKNKSAASNNEVLKYVQKELKDKSKPVPVPPSPFGSLAGGKIPPSPFNREISINDLEEIRKGIGKISTPNTSNVVFGDEMKKIIDASTEGKGGEKYQQARRMYENYAKDFKDQAVISKLVKNKPGTTDRAVALEDVFDHSIMKGSLDDVRNVRKTLQTAGDDGKQAWKELQGQTLRHIKDNITSGAGRDIKGNPIVSADKLNKMVSELDKDGKLDFIFGKQGAQKVRDVNDLAKDIYTAPPGSVNTSNTASILIGLLDTAVSGVSGLPLPIGSAVNYGVKKVKSNITKKKVNDALGVSAIPAPPQGKTP